MSDKPPPDKRLYLSPVYPGVPVEVDWISKQVYDTGTSTHSMIVVLTADAPEGYAVELAGKLREAFPGVYVTVI